MCVHVCVCVVKRNNVFMSWQSDGWRRVDLLTARHVSHSTHAEEMNSLITRWSSAEWDMKKEEKKKDEEGEKVEMEVILFKLVSQVTYMVRVGKNGML